MYTNFIKNNKYQIFKNVSSTSLTDMEANAQCAKKAGFEVLQHKHFKKPQGEPITFDRKEYT